MVNMILNMLASENGRSVTSVISELFMVIVLFGAIGINTWILLIRILDYKKMK